MQGNNTLLGDISVQQLNVIPKIVEERLPKTDRLVPLGIAPGILKMAPNNIAFDALRSQLQSLSGPPNVAPRTNVTNISNLKNIVKEMDAINAPNSDQIMNDWVKASENDPYSEIILDHSPNYITNDDSTLFVCDQYGSLTVLEMSSDKSLIKMSSIKLNFTNIRGIGVNSTHLAVTFSCLSKDDIKKYNKKLPVSGICFFKRNGHIVCRDLDSFINLPINGGFISPSGIVLNEEHMYVCDKEKQTVYKLKFKSGEILHKYKVDGKVCDVSLNSKFLVTTDYQAHELNLVDLNGMQLVKRVPVQQINKFEDGPFNVVLTRSNLIFVKNSTETDAYLFDINLNYKAKICPKFCHLFDLTFIESKNSLIISCKTNTSKHKLYCFSPEKKHP